MFNQENRTVAEARRKFTRIGKSDKDSQVSILKRSLFRDPAEMNRGEPGFSLRKDLQIGMN
jgi:Fe2+ transport system protein FeoA